MPHHHIGIFVNDLEAVSKFYEAALAPLGYKIAVRFQDGNLLGFAAPNTFPDFFINGPDALASQKVKAATGQETLLTQFHLAFAAKTREEVRKFYEAALAAGGKDNGEPGLRERYSPGYYSAYVTDPEGRNVEAVLINTEAED